MQVFVYFVYMCIWNKERTALFLPSIPQGPPEFTGVRPKSLRNWVTMATQHDVWKEKGHLWHLDRKTIRQVLGNSTNSMGIKVNILLLEYKVLQLWFQKRACFHICMRHPTWQMIFETTVIVSFLSPKDQQDHTLAFALRYERMRAAKITPNARPDVCFQMSRGPQ